MGLLIVMSCESEIRDFQTVWLPFYGPYVRLVQITAGWHVTPTFYGGRIDTISGIFLRIRPALNASQQGMQMKKLLPILIGLSLTGFSAMSERKTCFRFTSRHASATPICVNRQPIVTPRSKRSTKRAVHYCLSLGWERIIPIPMAIATATASTLTSPAVRCS